MSLPERRLQNGERLVPHLANIAQLTNLLKQLGVPGVGEPLMADPKKLTTAEHAVRNRRLSQTRPMMEASDSEVLAQLLHELPQPPSIEKTLLIGALYQACYGLVSSQEK